MFKTLWLVFVLFLALSLQSVVFADAGSCTKSSSVNEGVMSIITFLCTAHTDGSLSVTLNTADMADLAGRYILRIKSKPSTPAPTDNTTLEIVDSDGLSLLGTNGTSFIDATTTKETMMRNAFLGLNVYEPLTSLEPLTLTATGNAVSGAKFHLKFSSIPLQ